MRRGARKEERKGGEFARESEREKEKNVDLEHSLGRRRRSFALSLSSDLSLSRRQRQRELRLVTCFEEKIYFVKENTRTKRKQKRPRSPLSFSGPADGKTKRGGGFFLFLNPTLQ